jgi:hypothetical protein
VIDFITISAIQIQFPGISVCLAMCQEIARHMGGQYHNGCSVKSEVMEVEYALMYEST